MAISPTNLMDLMSAPSAAAPSGGSAARSQSGLGERRSRMLPVSLQAAPELSGEQKAAPETPVLQQKKPMSYVQLGRLLQKLSKGDQKSTKQLVHVVFPSLAVFSSFDLSLAAPLLQLLAESEDKNVIRFSFYFLARIIAESDTTSGGSEAKKWDAMVDLSAQGASAREDLIPAIVSCLAKESSSNDPAAQGRRAAALKAFVCVPASNTDGRRKLYSIVQSMFDKSTEGIKLRKKRGIFARQSTEDKESFLKTNLQYLALSTVRRLPPGSLETSLVKRIVQGIGCSDPVGARHAIAKLSSMATKSVGLVATALSASGSVLALQEATQFPDMFARAYLARLLSTLVHAPEVKEKRELMDQFSNLLFQLLWDESEKVFFEAISGIVGSGGGEGSLELRAAGWDLLCSAVVVVPETSVSKDGPAKGRAPTAAGVKRIVMKVAFQRLDYALCSSSRPVLHAAARVVGEIGKARAAAVAIAEKAAARSKEQSSKEDGAFMDGPSSVLDVGTLSASGGDLDVFGSSSAAPLAELEFGSAVTEEKPPEPKVKPPPEEPAEPAVTPKELESFLGKLMESVRTAVACECPYVRAAAIKGMIWIQSEHECVKELKETIAGELLDPAWPASLLNDLLLTLHLRFKATPSMAAMLLDVAGLWVTLVPSKVDTDVLQSLWKTCLMGCGQEGKQAALEAVGGILELSSTHSNIRISAHTQPADPKSAIALQRLIQAAVWFLGENANYAATEYAWEPPAAAGLGLLRMMEGSAMLAAAAGRNSTLALAIARLQRAVFCGSWEVRIVALHALMTIAIRSGEPYRFQIYEFFHTLYFGSKKDKLSSSDVSNGEDEGATGTGLTTVVLPMLRLLDEMYQAQDQLLKDMREHDNASQIWSDDELAKLYQTHERLLDLVSIYYYIPRNTYLPLGPWSLPLINMYRSIHAISTETTQDPAVMAGIADLLLIGGGADFMSTVPQGAGQAGTGLGDGLWAGTPPGMDLVNDFLGGTLIRAGSAADGGGVSQPGGAGVVFAGMDDMWALDGSDDERKADDGRSSVTSSPDSVRSSGSEGPSNYMSGLKRAGSQPSLMSPPREDKGEEEEDGVFRTKAVKSPSRFKGKKKSGALSRSSSIGGGSPSTSPPKDSLPATVGSPTKESPLPIENPVQESTPASSLPQDLPSTEIGRPAQAGPRKMGSFMSFGLSSLVSTDVSHGEGDAANVDADGGRIDSQVNGGAGNDDDIAGAASTDTVSALPILPANETAKSHHVNASIGDLLLDVGDKPMSRSYDTVPSNSKPPDSTPDLLGDFAFDSFPPPSPSPAFAQGSDYNATDTDQSGPKDDGLQFDFLGLSHTSSDPAPSTQNPTAVAASNTATDFLSDLFASGLGSTEVRNLDVQDSSTASQSAGSAEGMSTLPRSPKIGLRGSSDEFASGSGSFPSASDVPELEPVSAGKVSKRGKKHKSKDSDKGKGGAAAGILGLFNTGAGKSSTQSKGGDPSSLGGIGSESGGGMKRRGEALYPFTPGSDVEVQLEKGDALEVEYEVDGWGMRDGDHPRSKNGDRRGHLPLGSEVGAEASAMAAATGPTRGAAVEEDLGLGLSAHAADAFDSGVPRLSIKKPPLPVGSFRGGSSPRVLSTGTEARGYVDRAIVERKEEMELADEVSGKEGKKSKGKGKHKAGKKKDKLEKGSDEGCVIS